MNLDLRVRAFVLACYLAILPAFTHGQQHKVTLRGTLFQADGECKFFLDPTGESEGIQLLEVSEGVYLCDYLKGSASRPFVIIMGPE